MTLTLTPDLERRLAREAERAGKTPDEYAVELLDKQLPAAPPRNDALIALLQSWMDVSEEEAAEQKETGEYLIRVLDEDRLSDRKLFPPELKDISW